MPPYRKGTRLCPHCLTLIQLLANGLGKEVVAQLFGSCHLYGKPREVHGFCLARTWLL